LAAALLLLSAAAHKASAQQQVEAPDRATVEWSYVGGDAGNTRYSAADVLTPANVDQLEVAWTWRPADRPRQEFGTVPGSFTSTPIMVDGTVYVSSNYNRVAALDAETGAVRWVFDPRAYADGMPALGGGFRHRGVTMWRDGEDLRIFLASRHRLFCLDAETGQVLSAFGDDGVVDLSRDLIWPIDRSHFEFNAAPVIYKDLVIVGSAVFDPETTTNPFADADDPDYVGYDADLGGRATFEGGIPLNKPPYAYLVAVDLNAGDVAWRVPFGRGSDRLRAHPALQGLDLPDRLGTPGAPGSIVTKGGLVIVGGGEDTLYAFDKRTGREVWSALLPERSAATPMTYRTGTGRQFVLIATGSGASQELVAFATP